MCGSGRKREKLEFVTGFRTRLCLKSWCLSDCSEVGFGNLCTRVGLSAEGTTACVSRAASCPESCNAQSRQNGCGFFRIVCSSCFSAALLIAFPEIDNYTKIEINGGCECSGLSEKLLGLKKTHCTKSTPFNNNTSLALEGLCWWADTSEGDCCGVCKLGPRWSKFRPARGSWLLESRVSSLVSGSCRSSLCAGVCKHTQAYLRTKDYVDYKYILNEAWKQPRLLQGGVTHQPPRCFLPRVGAISKGCCWSEPQRDAEQGRGLCCKQNRRLTGFVLATNSSQNEDQT